MHIAALENPLGRIVVSTEGIEQVKDRLKTDSEELEEFLSAKICVAICRAEYCKEFVHNESHLLGVYGSIGVPLLIKSAQIHGQGDSEEEKPKRAKVAVLTW